ncbi:MAG: Rpn family recombination-promoting nuclease/putative transposase [Lachnospiraceae bacterium]|nr:Rpn family recombination-promoting nuclease/putative transposase [Lachnospiraceae bacterium]
MRRDELLKSYLSDNTRYADLINGYVFEGRQVVRPEDVTELDSQTGYRNGRTKHRDLLRKTALGMNFAIVGVENQDYVDYLMPMRVMGYDVGEYQRQAAIRRKELNRYWNGTKDEMLSGFCKKDLLTPCITLVLYYGLDWDGAKDIHSLLNLKDIPPEVLKWVSNYSINLINIRQIKDMDIFITDLKQVFSFIKYSEDKILLRRLVNEDPSYRQLEPEAYDVAVAFTRAKELAAVRDEYIKGGRVDMCKALTEMLQDERSEGIEQGIEQGKLDVLISLVEDGILSIAQAAERLGISEKDFRERMS